MTVKDKKESKKGHEKTTSTHQIMTDGLAMELGYLLTQESTDDQLIGSLVEQLHLKATLSPLSVNINDSPLPIDDWLGTITNEQQVADMLAGLAYKVEDQPQGTSTASPLPNQPEFIHEYVFPEDALFSE